MSGTVRRVAALAAMLPLVAIVVLGATPDARAGIAIGASLTIIKATSPASDPQDFDFDLTGAGVPADSDLDTDAGDATLPSQETFFLNSEQLGAHTVTESTVAEWSLTGLECPGAGGDSSVDLENRTATLDIDAGESVVCTFTNTKHPPTSLTIIKATLPASDPQDFDFDLTGLGVPADSDLDTDAGDATLPSQETFFLNSQQLGAHTVTESAVAGWLLTGLECTGGDDDGSVSLENRSATLDIDAGELVVCTFTNAKLPLVTLTKVTVPASDPQDFYIDILGTFNTSLDTDPASLDIPDSELASLAGTQLGSKTIEETAVVGWTLTDITCTEGSVISTDLANRTVTIDLEADSNIECIFTNTKDADPTEPPATDPPATPDPTADQGGESDAATEPGTSTEGSSAEGNSTLGVGVALIALIVLSGVLLLTRPKRTGK